MDLPKFEVKTPFGLLECTFPSEKECVFKNLDLQDDSGIPIVAKIVFRLYHDGWKVATTKVRKKINQFVDINAPQDVRGGIVDEAATQLAFLTTPQNLRAAKIYRLEQEIKSNEKELDLIINHMKQFRKKVDTLKEEHDTLLIEHVKEEHEKSRV
jgi:hypothetical protein